MIWQHEDVNAAIYCRFSKDDGKTADSSSIETQREMLTKYVREQNWRLHDTYVDDGFTGLNFDRPDFKRMMNDVDRGKINLVITKDLSRLGRNYLETGMYMEVIFPSKGVRYVSLNDGIDTLRSVDADIAPFRNILNEMYSKDLSRKVSSAKKTRFMQGKFTGVTVPYGYKKDENDRSHLVINEEYAPIVRRIFGLAMQGSGIGKIRQIMTEERVLRPGCVTFKNMQTYHLYFKGDDDPNCFKWSNNSVRGILRNPVYAGHLAGYRRPIPSMKSKKRMTAAPKDWLIVPDTHEPIIPPEDFKLVQAIISSRRRANRTGYKNIFAGLIKCADCGHAMRTITANRKPREQVISNIEYICSNYSNYSRRVCTSHRVSAAEVHAAVLNDIRYHADMAVRKHDKLLEKIIKQVTTSTKAEKNTLRRELNHAKTRVDELNRLFIRLYEDRNNEKISERNYTLVSKTYETEQETLQKKIDEIETLLSKDDDVRLNSERFIGFIKNYKNIITLDVELLNQLIEKITIGQAVKDREGEREQQITIHYKFLPLK